MLDESSTQVNVSHEEDGKSPQGSPQVDAKLNLIQIKAAGEEEVNRRIHAFIRHKRNEVDERNIREFISPFSSESETSCARVEAVYIRREGQKSHISLKRVENFSGPQTHLSADDDDGRGHLSYRVPLDVQRAEAVEERLCNIEAHLNMKNAAQDIFGRIKALEERVSFLEGLSPEYFTDGIPQKKQRLQQSCIDEGATGDLTQDENLSDINIKIRHLKQVLQEKVLDQQKEHFE